MSPEPAAWRAMAAADLAAMARIAGIVHAAFPERPEIAAERLRLFPTGCAVAGTAAVIGYAIAHPWRLGPPPALDTLLGGLPAAADCLYLHDVALLPEARGAGLGAALVARLRETAARHRLPHLALVAVHGSAPWWVRFGFARPPTIDAPIAAKLATYGSEAAYLIADL